MGKEKMISGVKRVLARSSKPGVQVKEKKKEDLTQE